MSQNEKLCPICGATVLEMYGCGMDVDRLVCSKRGCEYEKELDTITYIEPNGSFTTIDVAEDDDMEAGAKL